MGLWPSQIYAWPSRIYGGGPCDFSVSPSPFGLDFGTLDFGTSDSGLTIFKLYGVLFWILLKPHLTWLGGGPCDGTRGLVRVN